MELYGRCAGLHRVVMEKARRLVGPQPNKSKENSLGAKYPESPISVNEGIYLKSY